MKKVYGGGGLGKSKNAVSAPLHTAADVIIIGVDEGRNGSSIGSGLRPPRD